MQADPSAQRALLLIADLDTQTAQLRHRKATLPEHAKLAELAGKKPAEIIKDRRQKFLAMGSKALA